MKRERLVRAGLVALSVLAAPMPARAQCTIVGNASPNIVAAAEPLTLNIAANTVVHYRTALTGGRSYSLQVTTGELNFNSLPYVLCTTFEGSLTDTTSVDPVIITNGGQQGGRRVSFLPSVSTSIMDFRFQNSDAFSHTFTAVLVETTLFSPSWSTAGALETFYSCSNTTNSALDATLTLSDTAGGQVATLSFTGVPAGGSVSTSTLALGVANDLSGSARLTHNGPPDAFVCDASIVDQALRVRLTSRTIAVKFEPVRNHSN